MNIEVIYGVLIPLLGTTLGAACVFFMKNAIGDKVQRLLMGFASGVMVAASVWSLLNRTVGFYGKTVVCAGTYRIMGRYAFLTAA